MRKLYFTLALLMLNVNLIKSQNNDSLEFHSSFYYSKNLDSNFGGGNSFAGEVGVSKSIYELSLCFDQFQSSSIWYYPIVESNLQIPLEEIATGKLFSLSVKFIPIKSKYFTLGIMAGPTYMNSTSFTIKNFEYSYNLSTQQFEYIKKDYNIINNNGLGYNIGTKASFALTSKFDLIFRAVYINVKNCGQLFLVGAGIQFSY